MYEKEMSSKTLYHILGSTCRVAISGLSGCGNTTISQLLAERLGIRLVNYTFRNVAEERGVSLEEISSLAEKDPSIDYFVDERQKMEAKKHAHCIIGSRLAIWLIREANVKIYLDVKNEIRYARVQEREKKSFTEARIETMRRDKRNAQRYKRRYNIDVSKYASTVDFVVDNNLSPTSTVEYILSLLEKKKIISVKD